MRRVVPIELRAVGHAIVVDQVLDRRVPAPGVIAVGAVVTVGIGAVVPRGQEEAAHDGLGAGLLQEQVGVVLRRFLRARRGRAVETIDPEIHHRLRRVLRGPPERGAILRGGVAGERVGARVHAIEIARRVQQHARLERERCSLRRSADVGSRVREGQEVGRRVGIGDNEVDRLLEAVSRDLVVVVQAVHLRDERHAAVHPHQVVVEIRPQEVRLSLQPLLQCRIERGPIDLAEENVRLPDTGVVIRPVEVTESAVLEGAPVARGDDRLDDLLRVVVMDEVRLVADGGQHDFV